MSAHAHNADLPYKPLDATKQQIRLILFKYNSNRKRDTPRYQLHTFDVDEAPSYQAVSYTWGPEKPTNTIQLNGSFMEIRANLFAFLRTYHREGYLWIDQICIDQTNTEERNHQVQLMSEIYKDSDSVIVWLGSNYQRFLAAADAFSYKPKLKPLSTILRDTYFSRLWIVQEVLLAREVHVVCRGVSGVVLIPWSNMRAIANSTCLRLQERGHPERVLSLLARQGTTRYESLKWCIKHFSGYDCRDPRDKVYGLLGIVKERQRIEVDYSKPIPDVLVDVIKSFLQRGEGHGGPYAECRSTIEFLARQMGLESTDHRLQGLGSLLVDIFSRGKSHRSRAVGLPENARITDVGFSLSCAFTEAETKEYAEADIGGLTTTKRELLLPLLQPAWWCCYNGQKYYHACCSCDGRNYCKCTPGGRVTRGTFEPFSAIRKADWLVRLRVW